MKGRRVARASDGGRGAPAPVATAGLEETVGRRRELDRLNFALERASAGRSTCVVIRGPAGIGKSRILDHLTDTADAAGLSTRLVTCNRDPEDIDRLAAGLGLGWSADSWADHANPADASLDPERYRSHLTHRLVELTSDIARQASTAPLVVAVDDLHDASPTFLDLIDLLGQRLRQQPSGHFLLVVATRPTPDSGRVSRTVADLAAFAGCVDIEIDRLSPSEEAELCRRAVPAASPTFLEMVRAASGGNPLRNRAAAQMLLRRGVSPSVGPEGAYGLRSVRIPSVRDDPVVEWLKGLPAPLLDLLKVCAVIGRSFDADSLGPLMGETDEDELVDRLDAAVEAGVLATDGFEYWFAHSTYAEAIYAEVAASRRRRLHHEQAVRLMADVGPGGAQLLAIGRHLVRAGSASLTSPDTIRALIRAGQEAMAVGEWFEAAGFFDLALQTGEQELTPAERAAARYRHGVAHYFNHDLNATVASMTSAVRLATEVDDESIVAHALTVRQRAINNMDPAAYRSTGDMTEILEFVEAGRSAPLRALALQACAEAYITAGDLDHGRRTAEKAIDLARDGADTSTRAICTYALAYADLVACRVQDSLPTLLAAVDDARRCDDWYVRTALEGRLAFAHLSLGHLEQAEAAARAATEGARLHNEHSGQALGGAVVAAVCLLRGDLAQALAAVTAARLSAQRANYRGADLFLAPVEVLARLHENEPEAAGQALAGWPDLPRPLQQGLAAVIRTRHSSGEGFERPPTPPAWRDNQISAAAIALHTQAALWAGDPDQIRLGRASLTALTELGLALPIMAPLSLDRLDGEVELALGHPDAADRLHRAARRLTAQGADTELAATLFAQARATAGQPDATPDAARRLATRAAQIAHRVGMPRLVAEARALGSSGTDDLSRIEARGGRWTVILVTDVANSTSTSAELGDVAYHDLIMAHHELVRKVAAEHGGNEISDSGDGLYFWYDDTARAVRTALEIQRAVELHHSTGPELAVKVALAGGEPLFRNGRPYGLVLNRAFRVVDHARRGQIVLDEPVAAAVGANLIAEHLEPRHLKGIGDHRISVLRQDQSRDVSSQ